MKYYIFFAVCMLCSTVAVAQSAPPVEGSVSYKSSQNIYIKFPDTRGIDKGDTLYVLRDAVRVPVLVVQYTSSISVMGTLLPEQQVEVHDKVLYYPKEDQVTTNEPVLSDELSKTEEEEGVQEEEDKEEIEQDFKESIRGRLSVSMYQSMYGESQPAVQRMRYTFSLRAQHIQDSRLSAETYLSYRHQFEDWEADESPRSSALRVYSLAATYDAGKHTQISLGRKVNLNIANIGAIDGMQAQHSLGDFTVGGFVGLRPDYRDYGFNSDLLQYGGFVSHRSSTKHGMIQTSVALVEQRNAGMTDRRFTYLQHSSALTKNLSFFGSVEFDLYAPANDSLDRSAIHFTSTYVSLQYRPSRKLTLYGSYDARSNVIYYETYKSYLDQLLAQEMRQGLRFRANYRIVKHLSLGASAGYRFQKEQGSNSTNLHAYITHNRIPLIKATVMVSAILLRNDYLNGSVYGVRISRDIVRQKVFGQIEYRRADYAYSTSALSLQQDIFGANISWRMRKKLMFSVDYEGVFAERPSSRVHLNLIQRF